MTRTAAILLAGGMGTRFGASIPKQFFPLHGKPLILYSLEVLQSISAISEIVIVCALEYRHFFPRDCQFALPGSRRQDSVYSGLCELNSKADYVCIHDGARPLVTQDIIERVLSAAYTYGAATAGMPLKFTVKEHDGDCFVVNTPNRAALWEIQTPQIIKRSWLEEGFEKIHQDNVTVTDDVSLVESLGYPVKLVEGSSSNIKITTSEDLLFAACLNLDSCHV